jgi:uncharacterized protein DUF2652
MGRMTEPSVPVAPTFPRQTGEGPLLIADISGYTSFLQDVASAHAEDAFADGNVPTAYPLMSRLLDGIVGSVVPPFTLSKLEGDAVFAFARIGEGAPQGQDVLDMIDRCYAEFRGRLTEAGDAWTCTCGTCSRASVLDLKFVLHVGRFFVQDIAGSRELSGPDVNMAHRLLKNGAAEAVGQRAYLLLTDAAVSHLGIPTQGAVQQTQTPDDLAPVETFVVALN